MRRTGFLLRLDIKLNSREMNTLRASVWRVSQEVQCLKSQHLCDEDEENEEENCRSCSVYLYCWCTEIIECLCDPAGSLSVVRDADLKPETWTQVTPKPLSKGTREIKLTHLRRTWDSCSLLFCIFISNIDTFKIEGAPRWWLQINYLLTPLKIWKGLSKNDLLHSFVMVYWTLFHSGPRSWGGESTPPLIYICIH